MAYILYFMNHKTRAICKCSKNYTDLLLHIMSADPGYRYTEASDLTSE